MSAQTDTRPRPAATGEAGIRLPWWVLAVPMLAFVVLLALILNPADASAGGDPVLSHLVESVQQVLTHYAP